MRNRKNLLIEQLTIKLNQFIEASNVEVPKSGWIKTIRLTLNMTGAQLAKKLGMTTGAVQKIEEREANGKITLNKLKEAGEALDMKLVYGFVPKDGALDKLITKKAEQLAKKIVMRTNQTMKLEDQEIGNNKIENSIQELAHELKREMKKTLWD